MYCGLWWPNASWYKKSTWHFGATDLRKAVDGLAAIIQLDFDLSPLEPYLFAFCNGMRNMDLA
jgi:hypothetical protein